MVSFNIFSRKAGDPALNSGNSDSAGLDRQISEKIKFLGFLLTCFIVVYHCPFMEEGFMQGAVDAAVCKLTEQVVLSMGIFAMCHFFAVTGFLLFQNFSLHTYPKKIKRRVSSLLIPYVIWQVLTAVLMVVFRVESISIHDFIRRTFLFIPYPYDGALWYVYAVFFLAILSPLLLPLLRNPKVGWGCMIVFFLLLELRDSLTAPAIVAFIRYGYVHHILYYLASYLAGCFFGKFGSTLGRNRSLKYLLSALVVALLFTGLLPGFFFNLTVRLLPLAVLYLLPPVPRLAKLPVLKLSFLIYALHQPVIGVAEPVLRRIYSMASFPACVCNLITMSVILAACLCLAAAAHSFLKRFAPFLLRLLTGGRF